MKFTSFNQLPLYTDDFVFRYLDDFTKQDALVIHNPQDALVISPVLLKSRKPLDEHIDYIRNNNIKKAIIVANSIHFLEECPSLENLWVLPDVESEIFDYSPIYKLSNIKWLRCDTLTGLEEKQVASVDYSQFVKVGRLCIHGFQGHHNVAQARNVHSLSLEAGYPNSTNLKNCFPGAELHGFSISQAPITSLSGIEIATRLQRLDLSYNRRLTDISDLCSLKDTLAYLEIDTCGKISDFSVLETLCNLEFLILKGSNILPNLNFLKNMPSLKYLYLTMNVENGDMSLCKPVPYVRIQNRKHYSHKDKEFSKNYIDPNEAFPF